MLNVKNECRWIRQVIESLLPLCEEIFILDDHSDDETPNICAEFPQVRLWRSPFGSSLDKTRDKQYIFEKLIPHGPEWVVAIDGDEVLDPKAPALIRQAAERSGRNSLSLRIMYLWNTHETVRVDGVYQNFQRPSVFRLFNPSFGFRPTPFAGNLHCPNVPPDLLHGHQQVFGGRIWHYGYMEKETRLAKYRWRQKMEPNAAGEDHYRHLVQGDISEVPADAKLKWAGPLQLKKISDIDNAPFLRHAAG
jgi:glycosyltransferase involved in cell wall biosynthesis